MRLSRSLAIGAAALALLATLSGCGSDSESGSQSSTGADSVVGSDADSADGSGQATTGGLPQASDTAAVASYLNRYTPCQDVTTGDEYDTGNDGDAWGTDESEDPAWGIEERAVCADGSGGPIALLTVSDMKKFQTAAKASGDEFLVGEDFAVVPVGDEAIRDLQQSDLRFLSCDADLTVPSGFEKEPALVDGCVLTNYVPE
ncbi:hypothetical protein J2X68_003112 [Streptomyces sp. 3330]|uniref:hypothetical protein n=1 Tax=Streptomyces sp. 3330 TaxID=2817755 RepID=UPI0028587436|nr:hypothetical protein [Streptomyces sp. 3330]MDR6976421.1 hypothetical protein [Streptomyces sp. 3330]